MTPVVKCGSEFHCFVNKVGPIASLPEILLKHFLCLTDFSISSVFSRSNETLSHYSILNTQYSILITLSLDQADYVLKLEMNFGGSKVN